MGTDKPLKKRTRKTRKTKKTTRRVQSKKKTPLPPPGRIKRLVTFLTRKEALKALGTVVWMVLTNPFLRRIAYKAWCLRNPKTGAMAAGLDRLFMGPQKNAPTTLDAWAKEATGHYAELQVCKHYDPACKAVDDAGRAAGTAVGNVLGTTLAVATLVAESGASFFRDTNRLAVKALDDDSKLEELLSIDIDKNHAHFLRAVKSVWWTVPTPETAKTMPENYKRLAQRFWTLTIARAQRYKDEASNTSSREMYNSMIKVGTNVLRRIQ